MNPDEQHRPLPTPLNQRIDKLEAENAQLRELVDGIVGALQIAVVAIQTIERRD